MGARVCLAFETQAKERIMEAYVELHDLNVNPTTITRHDSTDGIKCPTDRFAVELCFEHKETITMGKLIAQYMVTP